MLSENEQNPEADPTELFVSQVMEAQRSLYAFILSLTQAVSEADDVLQEVNLVLWRKRAEFAPGTDFRAWAFRIARFQVMAWRKRQARDRLRFGDELLEQLAEEAESRVGQSDRRRTALTGCVEKLRSDERLLLERRYGEGLSAAELSVRDGRTPDGIYYALHRIHRTLEDCVRRTLAVEDHP